jgi:hypothetical protein
MFRRVLCTAAVVAVPAGLVVVALPGIAWAPPPPNAVGTAICKIGSGSGTVSPGLTLAGSSGGVKINFSASMVAGGTCGGSVTSPSGVTVVGGTLTGSGYYLPVPASNNGSKCANFAGSDKVGKIVVKINWAVVGPAIAPTKVVYKNNTGTVVGSGTDTITLDAPTGTAVKTRSFTTPTLPHKLVLVTTLPGPSCGSGSYGTFSILGGSNVSM